MKLGAPFPMLVEWGSDDLRRYAQEVESCGIDFVTVAGHVLAHPPGRFPDKPPRLSIGPYHDPMVLFAHLSGITERLRFRSSILILPLHTTVLIAAAVTELSILSGDRFELGVGVSWNEKEYQAAGQDIRRRGRRIDEQLQLLRLLWAHDRITFEGEFHHLDDVGLGRRPPTQPRIWLGATINDRSVPRMVGFGDGWIPGPAVDPTPHVPMLRQRLTDAGRDPSEFSINARIDLTTGDEATWSSRAEHLLSGGATHLLLDPGTGRPAAESAALVARAATAIRGRGDPR